MFHKLTSYQVLKCNFRTVAPLFFGSNVSIWQRKIALKLAGDNNFHPVLNSSKWTACEIRTGTPLNTTMPCALVSEREEKHRRKESRCCAVMAPLKADIAYFTTLPSRQKINERLNCKLNTVCVMLGENYWNKNLSTSAAPDGNDARAPFTVAFSVLPSHPLVFPPLRASVFPRSCFTCSGWLVENIQFKFLLFSNFKKYDKTLSWYLQFNFEKGNLPIHASLCIAAGSVLSSSGRFHQGLQCSGQ